MSRKFCEDADPRITRYCLYVIYKCGTPKPRLLRVQDRFRKLIATAKGGVLIDAARSCGTPAEKDSKSLVNMTA